MEEGKNKLCPLCARNTCNIHARGGGWYDFFCDNCFKYKLFDNIWERGLNGKPRDNSNEFFKELNKRWNAIYNFLLYTPHYQENELKQTYYGFAFFAKGALAPFEIDLDILLTDYPKNTSEKLNRILLNIYKKYGKNKFHSREFDTGLLFYEEGEAESEQDYWCDALVKKEYIKSTSFGAAQLTFVGVQQAEEFMLKREEQIKRLNAIIMLEKVKRILGKETDYQSDIIFAYNQCFRNDFKNYNPYDVNGVMKGGHDNELQEIIIKLENYLSDTKEVMKANISTKDEEAKTTHITNIDQSTHLEINGSNNNANISGTQTFIIAEKPKKKKWWKALFGAWWKICIWALGAVGTTLIGLWLGNVFG